MKKYLWIGFIIVVVLLSGCVDLPTPTYNATSGKVVNIQEGKYYSMVKLEDGTLLMTASVLETDWGVSRRFEREVKIGKSYAFYLLDGRIVNYMEIE